MTRQRGIQHIVWDWNGTLFADFEAIVAATNDNFQPHGIPPFTPDSLRAAFFHPLDECYAKIIGRPVTAEEFAVLDREWHVSYHQHMLTCGLTPDAVDSLTRWKSNGGTQSLLSMWLHDRLLPKVAGFGISDFFARVDGRLSLSDSGPKAPHLARHLAKLQLDPATVLVIGDTVDDGEAARRVGAQSVLYTGGSSTESALKATGFPVVHSLIEALEYA